MTGPAGEGEASEVFTGEFSFLSTTPNVLQPGLRVSVSPDIRISFSDVPTGYVNPRHQVLFDTRPIATVDRAVPHTIRSR